MRTKDLFKFIKERHRIYERKSAGLPKPWTTDPILQNYRFCNVYRELDTQTIWYAKNWRREHPDAWFAALVFRSVNWHETTEDIGYPLPWSKERFLKAIEKRKLHGKKLYSGAYMISTHGVRQEKHVYLANSLGNIWSKRASVRPVEGEKLQDFHTRLAGCFDVGSFISGQVIADIKYLPSMQTVSDWHTFATSGPGSRRGMNRVFNRELNKSWNEKAWWCALMELHVEIEHLVEKNNMPYIHAQDLQNCLCEFDKYERVQYGGGLPKSRYGGLPNDK